MFVTNIEDYPQDRIYKCNGLIAGWLVGEKNIPLLGKSEDGKFCFAKTELLLETLERLPFYYKVVSIVF